MLLPIGKSHLDIYRHSPTLRLSVHLTLKNQTSFKREHKLLSLCTFNLKILYPVFLSHLPVENNTISYSLIQERLEQPKEYSENPTEGNYEMNKEIRIQMRGKRYLGWFTMWNFLNQRGRAPFRRAAMHLSCSRPKYLEMQIM